MSGAYRLSSFTDYLTQKDWHELQGLCRQGRNPSLAVRLLIRAHRLLEDAELRSAFIEANSALEVALSEILSERIAGSLKDAFQSFWELPLPAQVIAVSAVRGGLPPEDLELALKSIKRRNAIIHEGQTPPVEAKQEVEGMLRTIGWLLGGLPIKMPSRRYLNLVQSAESWEADSGEDLHEAGS
jgi:hypothetical protein